MQEIIQFIVYHPILSISWISLLSIILYITFIGLISKVKIISRNEATRLINKEDAVVVDLRQYSEFRKGHIVGAINLLSTDIKNNNIGELNKYKDRPIIIVDDTDIQTRGPANKLNKIGFEKVFILKEGILGWNMENLPLIRGR